MQSLRTATRRLPQQLNLITKLQTPTIRAPFTHAATMSLFPRFTQEVSPLFRLLDDYDRATSHPFRHLDKSIRSFSPKFDVKELKDSYELHGEFPGIDQKDISIEWRDANTLTVSGRSESVREEGERPQGFIEGETHTPSQTQSQTGENKTEYHKPSVEDEGAEGKTDTQVTKTNENKDVVGGGEHAPKYWVTERSIGEFHRSFSFPAHVDQEGVRASLKNGVLSIVVPKARAPKPRKISIE